MNHREPDHHHDAEEKLRREVALFRYGVIAVLAQVPPGAPGLKAQLRAKAEQPYTIPATLRTRRRDPARLLEGGNLPDPAALTTGESR